MWDQTLLYFLNQNRIPRRDAAQLSWSHAVNSRSRLTEALTGSSHMMEADVIMRGYDPKEPIMAHPPDTDSDITLREWLEEVKTHHQGLKLDFKSLEALSPSLALLVNWLDGASQPLWINADILCGPGGQARPVEAEAFLSAVSALPAHIVLSLGWTTGWTAGGPNPGYSWDMVHLMEERCRNLRHPITFPVRAALLAQSFSQLSWLLQQSDRYSLTVWTGHSDEFRAQDLLAYREEFDVSRIYYDLPDSVRTQLTAVRQ
ncbi:protein FAM151B [Melanotaenia boesemani]|uniref:protein FAM151B n=1 Tax=Melanotaenia boesemani TaxID=1250792 RepID=UPI001C042C82|nr:protein FAM151B [Melanotaenia boesemani]XP_041855022.1 protein FAM151B [Melanotaenia boesemani]XP_041855023.1 protein FAM151B [Melanotaenia boesemani]